MTVKKTILLKTLEDAHTRMCEGESAFSRTCRHLHIAEKYPQALKPQYSVLSFTTATVNRKKSIIYNPMLSQGAGFNGNPDRFLCELTSKQARRLLQHCCQESK
jgi:hypothetical protein